MSTSPAVFITLQVPQMPMPQALGMCRPTLAAAVWTVSPGATRTLLPVSLNITSFRSPAATSAAWAAASAA
ncbi:hypothetical protein D3C80_1584590 [compost metagenome]